MCYIYFQHDINIYHIYIYMYIKRNITMIFPIAIHLCLGKAFVFLGHFLYYQVLGVATKISHGNAHGSVIKIGSRKFGVGGYGAMVLPPLWVTGDMEAPAGTKNMGSWTAKVRDTHFFRV